MTSVRRICGPLGILALFLLVQPAAAAAVPAADVAAEALAALRLVDSLRAGGRARGADCGE